MIQRLEESSMLGIEKIISTKIMLEANLIWLSKVVK